MTRNIIICKNCKETKTHCAKGLCKDCYNKLPEVKKRKIEYSQRPEIKEKTKQYQKEYYQQPEKIEHKKQWSKEYMQRPEVKERNNANMRRYRTDSKFKHMQEYEKQYAKEYNQRLEVKKRHRQYQQTPKRKQYQKEYYKRLGVKERIDTNKKRYRTDPKFKHIQEHEKQYHREYLQRPEIKERIYQLEQTPEKKKRRNESAKRYRKTDKGKKNMQNHNAYINLIYKPTHGDIELMPDIYPDETPSTPHHLKNDIDNPESKLWFYMFLPRITHEYVGGKKRNNGHWCHNAEWIKKLYCMNIKAFLEGKDFMTN